MHFYWLALAILCVWRVTHLLNAEDGPWELLVRLRRRAGAGFWGELLDCFYCLSLWIAAPLALLLGEGWKEKLLLWPALSAGAILLERATLQKQTATSAFYIEDEEDQDVLQQRKAAVPGDASQPGASSSGPSEPAGR